MAPKLNQTRQFPVKSKHPCQRTFTTTHEHVPFWEHHTDTKKCAPVNIGTALYRVFIPPKYCTITAINSQQYHISIVGTWEKRTPKSYSLTETTLARANSDREWCYYWYLLFFRRRISYNVVRSMSTSSCHVWHETPATETSNQHSHDFWAMQSDLVWP